MVPRPGVTTIRATRREKGIETNSFELEYIGKTSERGNDIWKFGD